MTAIIHRFRYPWGLRFREVDDPVECTADEALEMLADLFEEARHRVAYVDTLVQQPDLTTWLAEDWTPRVDQRERDRREADRERARETNLHHRSVA